MPVIADKKRRLATILESMGNKKASAKKPAKKPAKKGGKKVAHKPLGAGKNKKIEEVIKLLRGGTIGRASYKNVALRPAVRRRPGAVRSARGLLKYHNVAQNEPTVLAEQTLLGTKKRRARGTVNVGGDAVLAVGSKLQVYNGTAKRTPGGLKKADLMKNKHGKVISKKQHQRGAELYKRYGRPPFTQKKSRR